MTTNLKNVDLNLLVIFEAVYATGNISRAAERLGMSQPAVSNALARLRELIEDPLFVRAQRGVEPTMKAREMVRPVREALGLIGRQFAVGDEIDLSTYQRLFRIMLVDTIEPLMMPPIVRTITAQAPGISIESVQAHPKFAEDIRAGTIDLACFTFPIDTTDIVVRPLGPVDLVVVSRRDHPGITRPLDIETFERLPHIALTRDLRGMTNIDKSLVAQGSTRRIVYMASKIWSMVPMIERTDLIGILPRRFVQEICANFRLDAHELPTEILEQHAYMMWHVNSEHDPGHRWLRLSMMQAMRSNQ